MKPPWRYDGAFELRCACVSCLLIRCRRIRAQIITASTPTISAAPIAIPAMAPPLNDDVCVPVTAGVVAAAAPTSVDEPIELLEAVVRSDDGVVVALLPPKGVGPPFVGDVRTVLL